MVAPGSKESKQLEKVKRAFDKAYKDNVATRNREDVNYSLIGTDENGIEVYETSDDTNNKLSKDMALEITKIISSK